MRRTLVQNMQGNFLIKGDVRFIRSGFLRARVLAPNDRRRSTRNSLLECSGDGASEGISVIKQRCLRVSGHRQALSEVILVAISGSLVPVPSGRLLLSDVLTFPILLFDCL